MDGGITVPCNGERIERILAFTSDKIYVKLITKFPKNDKGKERMTLLFQKERQPGERSWHVQSAQKK